MPKRAPVTQSMSASEMPWSIARAVAALPRLLDIAGRLVGEDGVLLALKGRYPAGELDGVGTAWRYDVTELAVPGYGAGSRHAVLLEHRTI